MQGVAEKPESMRVGIKFQNKVKMKSKLKLNELKVSSFITQQQGKKLQGGNITNPGHSTNCYTLYQCGSGSGGSQEWCAV